MPDTPLQSFKNVNPTSSDPQGSRTSYRWTICGMLFFATTINYIDRAVLGVLKPPLERALGWDQKDYGWIVFAFQAGYALGSLVAGRIIDRIGVRLGLTLAVFSWSLVAMGHALVGLISPEAKYLMNIPQWLQAVFSVFGSSTASITVAFTVLGFVAARFLLGLTEGGHFPGAVKSVTEWFPRKERAMATGAFNIGSNIGALITPAVVPLIAVRLGWEAAFIIMGATGLIWLIFWLWIYQPPQHHPKVSAAELDYIRSDPPDPAIKIPWLKLLGHRQTWAFVISQFLVSPVWWFYLYWIPDYLDKQHHVGLLNFGPPMITIYTMVCFGSFGGGWLSSALLKLGWSVNASRKTAMLLCALLVVPVFLASFNIHLWAAVLLIGLAASAHSGYAANLFTVVSDTVPRHAVSSVVGLGGMAGAIGGMGFAAAVGYILKLTNNNYFIPFAIASMAYLVSLSIIHLLLPRLESMKLE